MTAPLSPLAWRDEIVAALKRAREAVASVPAVPPPEPPPRDLFRLRPSTEPPPEPPREVGLDEARAAIADALERYLAGDGERGLLIRATPGTGKTEAALEAVQGRAREGERIVWLSPAHRNWDDIAARAKFQPGMWHHWLGILDEDADGPLCRHADAMAAWLERGYPSLALCQQLCGDDGIAACRYRAQGHTPAPVIFGAHQHLRTGMRGMPRADVLIVDELPLSALIERRRIGIDDLLGVAQEADGPVRALLEEMAAIAATERRPLYGRALFDRIAPHLRDAYAQVELDIGALPVIPRIRGVWEITSLRPWFLPEWLRIAAIEYAAHERGMADWLPRTWIGGGLLRYQRDGRIPWRREPRKIVVLDGTGDARIYERLFGRPFETVRLDVKRRGRLYQVVGRLYGKRRSERDTTHTREAVETIRALRSTRSYRRIAVVAHLAVEETIRDALPDATILHFYGQRGLNAARGVDALFVIGTPQPPLDAVADAVRALSPDRVAPLRAAGYALRDEHYLLTPDGWRRLRERMGWDGETRSAVRAVGDWEDEELRLIAAQWRRAELEQAIHRARPILDDADIWLLSPVALPLPIDDLWEEPPIAPRGIPWRRWLRAREAVEALLEAGEPLTYTRLAELLGTSEGYLRGRRALEAIAAFDSRWRVEALRSERGRPKMALKRA